eukprot:765104-Hanusia_phi.AAC.6
MGSPGPAGKLQASSWQGARTGDKELEVESGSGQRPGGRHCSKWEQRKLETWRLSAVCRRGEGNEVRCWSPCEQEDEGAAATLLRLLPWPLKPSARH